eukprot:SM000064S19763  [mRNA]  locus=s64:290495:292641:- [translate_table: standard]
MRCSIWAQRRSSFGLVEQIGSPRSSIRHTVAGNEPQSANKEFSDHHAALQHVVGLLHNPTAGPLGLAVVGHRVVHGGEKLTAPVVVDDRVKAEIEASAALAPLHNPHNLEALGPPPSITSLRPSFPHPSVPYLSPFHSTFLPSLPLLSLPLLLSSSPPPTLSSLLLPHTLHPSSLRLSMLRASPAFALPPLPLLAQGIRVAEELFACPQVAVFDTAFHATLPPAAYMYALPYSLYEELGLRRYGMHGTSYAYMLGEAARMLGRSPDTVDLIAAHLGAGASMAVIKAGRCVDTSMGVTPLEGLAMATRCGDIDPAIPGILAAQRGMKLDALDRMLNKESGLYGLCGEKDMRTIVARAEAGDNRAALALDVFVHRARKYLGAYLATLGGPPHALVFSAGIGERSAVVRSRICAGLSRLGIELNEGANAAPGSSAREVHSAESTAKILVIPTDEELCIARQALTAIEGQ